MFDFDGLIDAIAQQRLAIPVSLFKAFNNIGGALVFAKVVLELGKNTIFGFKEWNNYLCGSDYWYFCMKTNNYWDALHEQIASETNIKLVSAFEYINDLLQSGVIKQEEFQLGKQVMLTYDGPRRKDDYQESFLEAIPFLYKALQNRVIDNTQYHEAVRQTLNMQKEKFLAQLLYVQLISYSDYKNSEKSNLVQFIVSDDLPSFGITPVRTAILLADKYGFRTIYSSIKRMRQTIIMGRGNNQYTLVKTNGLFGSKKTITDESNKTYSYPGFLNKLTADYGSL